MIRESNNMNKRIKVLILAFCVLIFDIIVVSTALYIRATDTEQTEQTEQLEETEQTEQLEETEQTEQLEETKSTENVTNTEETEQLEERGAVGGKSVSVRVRGNRTGEQCG